MGGDEEKGAPRGRRVRVGHDGDSWVGAKARRCMQGWVRILSENITQYL